MITIYWYCYETPKDEKFVEDSLNEMAEHLKKAPIELNVTIKTLRDEPDLVKAVDKILHNFLNPQYDADKCNTDITSLFVKHSIYDSQRATRILIYLNHNGSIAKNVNSSVKRNTGLDNWGVTSGWTSLIYEPRNKWIIWHEALHLLGVDECYNKNTRKRKPDCKCETCIMRYKPSKKWQGEFSLCEENINKLQDLRDQWLRNQK